MNDIENYGLKKYFISYIEKKIKSKISFEENDTKLKEYKEVENFISTEKVKNEEENLGDNESKLKEYKGEGDFIVIEKEKNEEKKCENEKNENYQKKTSKECENENEILSKRKNMKRKRMKKKKRKKAKKY